MNDVIPETSSQPPGWLAMWTTPSSMRIEYDDSFLEHARAHARHGAMFAAMVRFPPRCVIELASEGNVAHGIVLGVCWLQLPEPTTGKPRHVIALRYVTNPLQVPGALGARVEGELFVLPSNVKPIGYVPGFTPDIMRALLRPAGRS